MPKKYDVEDFLSSLGRPAEGIGAVEEEEEVVTDDDRELTDEELEALATLPARDTDYTTAEVDDFLAGLKEPAKETREERVRRRKEKPTRQEEGRRYVRQQEVAGLTDAFLSGIKDVGKSSLYAAKAIGENVQLPVEPRVPGEVAGTFGMLPTEGPEYEHMVQRYGEVTAPTPIDYEGIAQNSFFRDDTIAPEPGTVGRWFYDVVRTTPQFAAQIGAAIAGGAPVAAGFMFSQIGGNTYKNLIDQGVDKERAFNYMLANASIQSALEQVPFGKVTGKFLQRVVKRAVGEGATEGIQEYVDAAMELLATTAGMSPSERASLFAEKLPETTQNALYSASIGAAVGAPAHAVTTHVEMKGETPPGSTERQLETEAPTNAPTEAPPTAQEIFGFAVDEAAEPVRAPVEATGDMRVSPEQQQDIFQGVNEVTAQIDEQAIRAQVQDDNKQTQQLRTAEARQEEIDRQMRADDYSKASEAIQRNQQFIDNRETPQGRVQNLLDTEGEARRQGNTHLAQALRKGARLLIRNSLHGVEGKSAPTAKEVENVMVDLIVASHDNRGIDNTHKQAIVDLEEDLNGIFESAQVVEKKNVAVEKAAKEREKARAQREVDVAEAEVAAAEEIAAREAREAPPVVEEVVEEAPVSPVTPEGFARTARQVAEELGVPQRDVHRARPEPARTVTDDINETLEYYREVLADPNITPEERATTTKHYNELRRELQKRRGRPVAPERRALREARPEPMPKATPAERRALRGAPEREAVAEVGRRAEIEAKRREDVARRQRLAPVQEPVRVPERPVEAAEEPVVEEVRLTPTPEKKPRKTAEQRRLEAEAKRTREQRKRTKAAAERYKKRREKIRAERGARTQRLVDKLRVKIIDPEPRRVEVTHKAKGDQIRSSEVKQVEVQSGKVDEGEVTYTLQQIAESYPNLVKYVQKRYKDKVLTVDKLKDLEVYMSTTVPWNDKARNDLFVAWQELADLLRVTPKKTPEYYDQQAIIDAAVEDGTINARQGDTMKIILGTMSKEPDFALVISNKERNAFYNTANIMSIKDPHAFAHELGHWGYMNILTPQERMQYTKDMFDNLVKDSREGTNLAKGFRKLLIKRGALPNVGTEGTFTIGNMKYVSNVTDNLNEYFAEQFSQYIAQNQLTRSQHQGLFEKLRKLWIKILSRVRDQGLLDEELIPYFEKLAPTPEVRRLQHVTAASFEVFDPDFIGTGHGGKEFGHGFYFSDYGSESSLDHYKRQIARKLGVRGVSNDGMYNYDVECKVKPYDLLDWDAVVSKRNRERIVKLASEKGIDTAKWDFSSGMKLYEHMEFDDPNFESAEEVSKFFVEAGIKGTIWEQEDLTGRPAGRHNYVIYDPDLLQIKDRIELDQDTVVKVPDDAPTTKFEDQLVQIKLDEDYYNNPGALFYDAQIIEDTPRKVIMHKSYYIDGSVEGKPVRKTPYAFIMQLWKYRDSYGHKVNMAVQKLNNELYKVCGTTRRTQYTDRINKALQLYMDSGHNIERIGKFKSWAEGKIADKKTPRLERYKIQDQLDIVKDMEALTDDQKNFAKNVLRPYYDSLFKYAQKKHIIGSFRENYVKRSWYFPKNMKYDEDFVSTGIGFTGFKVSVSAAKHRKLDSIFDGWEMGLSQKNNGAIENVDTFMQEFAVVLANRRFQRYGLETHDLTGNTMFSFEPRTGYAKLEALSSYYRKMKYDANGDPVYEVDKEGNRSVAWDEKSLYAPAKIAKHLNTMTKRDTLFFDTPALDSLLRFGQHIKVWDLGMSAFHVVAGARSWIFGVARTTVNPETGKRELNTVNPFKAYKMGLDAMNASDEILQLGVENGLTLGRIQDVDLDSIAIEDQGVDKMFGYIFGRVGQKGLRFTKQQVHNRYTKWMFGKFFAGLKAQAFMTEYSIELAKAQRKAQQKGREFTEADVDDVAQRVAWLINADFGGLHYGRMGRNASLQKLAQLTLLAPDWTESNIRTVTGMVPIPRIKEGDQPLWQRIRWDKSLNQVIDKGLGQVAEPNNMKRLYYKFWAGAIVKGVLFTIMANMLTRAMNDDEDDFMQFYDRTMYNFDIAKRMRWTEIDISGLVRALGGNVETGEYATLSLVGHFKDPVKAALAPASFFTGKLHPINTAGIRMATGKDFAQRPFTDVAELMNSGTVVKASKYEDVEPFWLRMPSTVLNIAATNIPASVGAAIHGDNWVTKVLGVAGLHPGRVYSNDMREYDDNKDRIREIGRSSDRRRLYVTQGKMTKWNKIIMKLRRRKKLSRREEQKLKNAVKERNKLAKDFNKYFKRTRR